MDPTLGEIRLFAFGFAPTGWALCNGQSMVIAQNQALYSLIGIQFGGNTTNFNLPKLNDTNLQTGANFGPTTFMCYYIATQGLYPMRP
jgi:microcystin-dependent protein